MNSPALVSLTFDDGLRCQFEQAVPILNQHRFSATFFLIANTESTHEQSNWPKINWSDQDNQFLKSMILRGHEIGAHSVTHLPARLYADPKGEAANSKRWIEDRLEVEIPSYAYPFYRFSRPIRKAVINAGYQQARSGKNQSYYALNKRIDFFDVDCRQISDGENVHAWLKPGFWHILTFHGIGDRGWSPISLTEFDRQMVELAEHRNAGAVEVVTFREGADRFRPSA
ncbi:MAG: polysaccharide deacetylase family protein [Candidatus Acidiferrales bacterium]